MGRSWTHSWIFWTQGLGPNFKWVDDNMNFRVPAGRGEDGSWHYTFTVQDIFAYTATLGVLWHKTKWTVHRAVNEYLGLTWSLAARTVGPPEKNRLKYLAKASEFLARTRVDRRATESLNGTLAHIAFVFRHGRAFLPNLFTASFKHAHQLQKPPPSVTADVRWWREVLCEARPARSLRPRGVLQDRDIWVDASTEFGIGLIVGNSYAAWKWRTPRETWKAEGRDIGWAEAVAYELAIRFLEQDGIADAEVLVRGDNQGVVGAVARGRSRSFQVNLVLRRAEAICMARNLAVRLVYLSTSTNRADPVSRGTEVPLLQTIPTLFPLPAELAQFLAHA